jgi:hypothetical protein
MSNTLERDKNVQHLGGVGHMGRETRDKSVGHMDIFIKQKSCKHLCVYSFSGGVDETRTRSLLRDRQVL